MKGARANLMETCVVIVGGFWKLGWMLPINRGDRVICLRVEPDRAFTCQHEKQGGPNAVDIACD